MQVCLVSGASTGFGHLMAKRFAEVGFRFFAGMNGLSRRNAETIYALQDELQGNLLSQIGLTNLLTPAMRRAKPNGDRP